MFFCFDDANINQITHNGHYDKYAFYFYKIINIINSLLY